LGFLLLEFTGHSQALDHLSSRAAVSLESRSRSRN
jgi:hypothetical protein